MAVSLYDPQPSSFHVPMYVLLDAGVLNFSLGHVSENLQLAFGDAEGGAGHVAGLEAEFQPFHALGAGSMSEGIRLDVTLSLFLKVIVAYDIGTVDGFFYVSRNSSL